MAFWHDRATGLDWELIPAAQLEEELTVDEALAYAAAACAQKRDGFDDWRLPSMAELSTLASVRLFAYRSEGDALAEWARWQNWADEHERYRNNGYFIIEELAENIGRHGWYWSADTEASGEQGLVNFKDGNTNTNAPSQSFYVRLVRG